MDLRIEIFQQAYWIQNCDRLKFCADILIEKLLLIKDEKPIAGNSLEHYSRIRAILETNLLLLGYAVENLLKGYLIYKFLQGDNIPKDADLSFLEKQVWKTSNTHNLVSLAKNTNLIFTERQLKHLKKLSKYTTWKGRYHIPKDSQGIETVIEPGIGDSFTSDDTKIVEELIVHVKHSIRK
jgi:hypothetical protein